MSFKSKIKVNDEKSQNLNNTTSNMEDKELQKYAEEISKMEK